MMSPELFLSPELFRKAHERSSGKITGRYPEDAARSIAFAALPEPCIPSLDPPGDRVHVLNAVRGYLILQGLPDAVERPGARCNAIVNRDA